MTIFERIKKLNLPNNEYVVVGGAMEAHGIRNARDIDIVVTKKLFNELSKARKWDKYVVYQEYSYGIKKIMHSDELDVISHYSFEDKYYCPIEELITGADVIEGISFVSLHELLKWKKACAREKDLKDVILIEDFLKNGYYAKQK